MSQLTLDIDYLSKIIEIARSDQDEQLKRTLIEEQVWRVAGKQEYEKGFIEAIQMALKIRTESNKPD